jgi:hypothetical protein
MRIFYIVTGSVSVFASGTEETAFILSDEIDGFQGDYGTRESPTTEAVTKKRLREDDEEEWGAAQDFFDDLFECELDFEAGIIPEAEPHGKSVRKKLTPSHHNILRELCVLIGQEAPDDIHEKAVVRFAEEGVEAMKRATFLTYLYRYGTMARQPGEEKHSHRQYTIKHSKIAQEVLSSEAEGIESKELWQRASEKFQQAEIRGMPYRTFKRKYLLEGIDPTREAGKINSYTDKHAEIIREVVSGEADTDRRRLFERATEKFQEHGLDEMTFSTCKRRLSLALYERGEEKREVKSYTEQHAKIIHDLVAEEAAGIRTELGVLNDKVAECFKQAGLIPMRPSTINTRLISERKKQGKETRFVKSYTKQHSDVISEMVRSEPIKTPRKVLAAMIEKQFETEGMLVMPLETIYKKITALRKKNKEMPNDKNDPEESLTSE